MSIQPEWLIPACSVESVKCLSPALEKKIEGFNRQRKTQADTQDKGLVTLFSLSEALHASKPGGRAGIDRGLRHEPGCGDGIDAIGSVTERYPVRMRGSLPCKSTKQLGCLQVIHRLEEQDVLGKRVLASRIWNMRMGTGGPICYGERRSNSHRAVSSTMLPAYGSAQGYG